MLACRLSFMGTQSLAVLLLFSHFANPSYAQVTVTNDGAVDPMSFLSQIEATSAGNVREGDNTFGTVNARGLGQTFVAPDTGDSAAGWDLSSITLSYDEQDLDPDELIDNTFRLSIYTWADPFNAEAFGASPNASGGIEGGLLFQESFVLPAFSTAEGDRVTFDLGTDVFLQEGLAHGFLLEFDPSVGTKDALDQIAFQTRGPGSTAFDPGRRWNADFDLAAGLYIGSSSNANQDLVFFLTGSTSTFLPGDFDTDGQIDVDDWLTLRGNMHSGNSFSAYTSGDMSGDGVVNTVDYRLFKDAYVAANPSSSFAELVASAVPEPSTSMMVILASLAIVSCVNRQSLRFAKLAILLVAGQLVLVSQAEAITATFNRTINDNTGNTPWFDHTSDPSDPGNLEMYSIQGAGAFEGSALNGVSNISTVSNNTTLTITGTATEGSGYTDGNMIPDGVVIDYSISFDVFTDAANRLISNSNNGIGVTTTDGLGITDDFNETVDPIDEQNPSAQEYLGFNNLNITLNSITDTLGLIGGTPTLDGNFYSLRSNDFTEASEGAIMYADLAKTTIIESYGTEGPTAINNAFNNNVPENNEMYLFSTAGDFRIKGIGVRWTFDYTLDNEPTPETLFLEVNTNTGEVKLEGGTLDHTIDYYEISSAGGSLDTASWSSLEDADLDGNGVADDGIGWEEIDSSSSTLVAEAILETSGGDLGTFFAAETSTSLGGLYDTSVDAQDLEFNYYNTTGELVSGLVRYVTSTSLEGDFNDDGIVDAADYTVWRDNLGGDASTLNGNGDGDSDVDVDDYNLWVASYGNSSSSSTSQAAAVPEPTSAVLLLIGLAGVARLRK